MLWSTELGRADRGVRDGSTGLNAVTSGAPVVPDDTVDLFPFAAGQAPFDATVEVAPA